MTKPNSCRCSDSKHQHSFDFSRADRRFRQGTPIFVDVPIANLNLCRRFHANSNPCRRFDCKHRHRFDLSKADLRFCCGTPIYVEVWSENLDMNSISKMLTCGFAGEIKTMSTFPSKIKSVSTFQSRTSTQIRFAATDLKRPANSRASSAMFAHRVQAFFAG